MLAHLIKLLFNRSNGRRKAATWVFICPECREVRTADEVEIFSQTAEGLVLRRECQERYFQCKTCTRKFNADSFTANTEGIYEVRTWDCPKCKHLNPATSVGCSQCGFFWR